MSNPSRRWVLRVFALMAVAIWVTLWPHNYGIQAHTWWLRLGACLLLAFRALFIGYGATWIIMRPLLTVRYSNERPIPSVADCFRVMVHGSLRVDEETHD